MRENGFGRRVLATTAFVLLVLGSSGIAAADDPSPPEPVTALAVTGDVRNPTSITLDELRALPEQTRSVTFESGTRSRRHTYVGAMLSDVVSAADPALDTSTKNPLLSVVILATGADGYNVALTWAEVSPAFTPTPILVAYTEDDAPLDRPRLVAPGDIAGGRYVSDLTELRLVNLRE